MADRSLLWWTASCVKGSDMSASRPRMSAMTLIELIVAVSLGMALIALAWTAFVRVKSSAARATMRVELHMSAAVIREFLQRDLGNMAPALAMFVRSTPQVPQTVANGLIQVGDKLDTVELVFMTCISPLIGHPDQDGEGYSNAQFKADYHWVRWRFQRVWRDGQIVSTGLYRSRSTPTRSWQTNANLAATVRDPADGSTWNNYNGKSWINLPRPLRDASQGIASLDNNRYGIPSAAINATYAKGDIGDLEDLDLNEQIISSRVRDLIVSWEPARQALTPATRTAITVESGTAFDLAGRIDGLHMDGSGPYASRPRIMRIAFSLADVGATGTGINQDFAISVATPGLLPQVGQ
jgi:Tfp pilus assembly protein PilE